MDQSLEDDDAPNEDNDNIQPDVAQVQPQEDHQIDQNANQAHNHQEIQQNEVNHRQQLLIIEREPLQHHRLENERPNNQSLGTTKYENWRSTKKKAKKSGRVSVLRKSDASSSE